MTMEHINESAVPRDPTYNMGAQAATAKLAEMTAAFQAREKPGWDMKAPTTSAEARNRLDALVSDPAWRNKFESYDSATRAEFHALTNLSSEGGPVEHALAGIVPPGGINTNPGADLAQMADAVPFFRELGIRDEVIRELLEDRPSYPIHLRQARERKEQRMKDKAWVERWFNGGREERREMMLLNFIICTDPER
jgi:hypothetical protein